MNKIYRLLATKKRYLGRTSTKNNKIYFTYLLRIMNIFAARYKKYLLFLPLLICVSACVKPPTYDVTPTVSFVGFSQDTLQQQTGVTTFIVGFTDGDGDLGSDENNVTNMLIIDTRRNDTLYYRIPPIPKQGASDAISGEIEVDIAQICCQDPDFPINCLPLPNTYQSVVYRISIRDNADRWSNEILTTPLTIKCFE